MSQLDPDAVGHRRAGHVLQSVNDSKDTCMVMIFFSGTEL